MVQCSNTSCIHNTAYKGGGICICLVPKISLDKEGRCKNFISGETRIVKDTTSR